MNDTKTDALLVFLTVLPVLVGRFSRGARGIIKLFSTHPPIEGRVARLGALIRGVVS